MKRILIIIALLLALSSAGAVSAKAEENMLPSGMNYVYSGGWIYYNIKTDEHTSALNRVRTDGTDAQRIFGDGAYRLSVSGDTLYFLKGDDFYRMNTDGTGLTLIGKVSTDGWDLKGLCVTADYVYALVNHTIYRYSIDPWKLIGEIKLPERFDNNFLIVDGWIYLSDAFNTNAVPTGGKFYRVRTDGAKNVAWFEPEGAENDTLGFWTILNQKLYYEHSNPYSGKAELRRVNLDGTGDELVLNGLLVKLLDGEWAYGIRYPESMEEDDYYMEDPAILWRANITTGAFELLGNYRFYHITPVGDMLIYYDDFEWSGKAPMLYNKDMSGGISLAGPGDSAPADEKSAPEETVVSVSLSIKEGSLSPSEATLLLANQGNTRIGTGAEYSIERKIGDAYEPVEYVAEDIYFTSVLYVVNKNDVREESVDWSNLYGELETGKYRITKTIFVGETQYDVSTEFIIE